MSVPLRLKGLPRRANPKDIREFFFGLDIPEGGVNIIGGPDGEAFVDVATWDNAYEALQMSGQQISDSDIQISVVSPEEKQQALENCLKAKESSHGRNGTREEKSNETKNPHSRQKNFYLRVDISEFEPTQTDIKTFFDGVNIKDSVFSKDGGSSTKAVVIIMFDNKADATEGYNRFKDSKILHILWSSEREWIKFGGKLDNDKDDCISSTSGNSRRKTHSRSPRRHSRSSRRQSRSPRRRSRSPRRYSRSPRRHSRSRRKHSRSPQIRSRSPRKRSRSPRRRSRSRRYSGSRQSSSRSTASEEQDLTNPKEYHVKLMNLSYRVKREDLKKLFDDHVRDEHIIFLYDENARRSREGFATFTSEEHFKKALTLDKVMLKGHKLEISHISTSKMQKLLSSKVYCNGYSQAYIYLSNFSPDVTKGDVQEFFEDFSLNENDIFLLTDKNNTCQGDVLVKFPSLEETSKAESVRRTTFKDKRIALKVVYDHKLTSFLHAHNFHMSIDLNQYVTQEDDPSEDEVTQENDTCAEPVVECVDAPKDDCVGQKETLPECVPLAD